MGLDWVPMGKPKPGFDERFKEIFRLLTGQEKQHLSLLARLTGKKLPNKEELLAEWFENSIKTYETIKAPRVGRDRVADEWIKEKYHQSSKSISQEDYINRYDGYYVIELAEELDGVPMYIPFDQDKNVFRGQFLSDCEDLIGKELLESMANKICR